MSLQDDSHSPGAINTPKYQNPLGFAEFLPDLAYVEEIANEIQYCWCGRGLSGPRNTRSGLLLNGLKIIFLWPLRHAKTGYLL